MAEQVHPAHLEPYGPEGPHARPIGFSGEGRRGFPSWLEADRSLQQEAAYIGADRFSIEDLLAIRRRTIHLGQRGERVKPIAIGTLTPAQLAAINQARQSRSLPAIIAEVLFFGQHIHDSRVVRDGYTIQDVIDQIVSAMDASATFVRTSKMVGIQNHTGRLDRYGNTVQDQAIFECTARHPRPELFSVIPKGDKPPKS